jgi:hypothetical protein
LKEGENQQVLVAVVLSCFCGGEYCMWNGHILFVALMVITSTNFFSVHSMVRLGMDIRNSKLTLHNLVARKSDIFEPSSG